MSLYAWWTDLAKRFKICLYFKHSNHEIKLYNIMDMSNFETKENNRLRLWDWRKRLDDVDKFSLFPRSFSVSFEFSSIFISLSVAESRMMRLRTLPNHCSLQVLVVEKRKKYILGISSRSWILKQYCIF